MQTPYAYCAYATIFANERLGVNFHIGENLCGIGEIYILVRSVIVTSLETAHRNADIHVIPYPDLTNAFSINYYLS